ncbi:hypothetical protein GCM10029992_07160 [Glycomyces albus]
MVTAQPRQRLLEGADESGVRSGTGRDRDLVARLSGAGEDGAGTESGSAWEATIAIFIVFSPAAGQWRASLTRSSRSFPTRRERSPFGPR